MNSTKVVKQKNKHRFDPLTLNRGVVFVNHLPHGFYEEQLEKYFGQFGNVTRLRVGRSQRTGRSKGYAFVEFDYPEVAQVAAETMNNYLMFREILKTAYIPPEKQTHNYFKKDVIVQQLKNGEKKLISDANKRCEEHIAQINKPMSKKRREAQAQENVKMLKFVEKRLKNAGIDVDLSGVIYDPLATKEKKPKIKVENLSPVKVKKETKAMSKTAPEAGVKQAKGKKGKQVNGNLPANTIRSKDEDSDVDDYKPTDADLAQADAYVRKLLAAEDSDSESDEDYDEEEIANQEREVQAAIKKIKSAKTVDKNNDSMPAAQKRNAAKIKAQAVAQKVKEQAKSAHVKKSNLQVKQKIDKVPKRKAPTEEPVKAKKQKQNVVAVQSEPQTPPKKKRSNFVSAPTPDAPVKVEKKKPAAKNAAPQAEAKVGKKAAVKQVKKAAVESIAKAAVKSVGKAAAKAVAKKAQIVNENKTTKVAAEKPTPKAAEKPTKQNAKTVNAKQNGKSAVTVTKTNKTAKNKTK